MKSARFLMKILQLCVLLAILAGCGNIGPLVHPDKAKPADEPAAPSN